MTLCRSCGHDKLNHHGGFGTCKAQTALILRCTCRTFVPDDAFESPHIPVEDHSRVDEAYDLRIERMRGGEI